MLNFCTLFDVNYLSRGLALYESLIKNCSNFHLYIFAFDDASFSILRSLQLPKVTLISLNEFEDQELLLLKPTRSRGEYCWTCTPSTIWYVLNTFHVSHCTYIDADLYFYADPQMLINEMGNKSVLITEHRFSPQYSQAMANGKYCVQFMTFRNDSAGLEVLNQWRESCNEWCYNRLEDGKFGDQKYLDDWTSKFECVHELQHLGGGVAPWNIQQYNLYYQENKFYGREKTSKKTFKVIFYHFHGLRFLQHNLIDLCEYSLSADAEQLIYRPYLNHLENIKRGLERSGSTVKSNEELALKLDFKNRLRSLKRKITGNYNIYDHTEFLSK